MSIGQALKSNQGEHDWKEFFSSVSEQFSLMEEIHFFDTFKMTEKFYSFHEKVIDNDNKKDERIKACRAVQDCAKKLNVIRVLEAYSHSLKIIDGKIEENAIDGCIN